MQKSLASHMISLELAIKELPVEELRIFVMNGEALIGKDHGFELPSGNAFDRHTQRARLWLDFIDELTPLMKLDQ